jgi:uncharacterized phage-like protein YoqJ
VLPCPDQTRGWSDTDKQKYKWILERADKKIYTSEHYFNGCMHKRNRHLVDNSDYCICYLRENKGGTFYTVNYARKMGVVVVEV